MALYVDIEKKCGDFTLKAKFETKGEVFAILGASGCGKSLTLKCIAGIEKPDRGVIRLDGRVFFDSGRHINLPARKRRVGYLFQDYALFPNMTVLQNIMCGAGSREKAMEYVERFYLKDKLHLYPAQLSGGQKQRAAMARMLSAAPDIIMLDEPFSALDNYLKTQLEREVMKALDSFGGTALFVSHDRNEVYRMTDRIAVMDEGEIVDIQPKRELFQNPRTLAATLLTGCKNVTRLAVDEEGAVMALDWGVRLETPLFPGGASRGLPKAGVSAADLTTADVSGAGIPKADVSTADLTKAGVSGAGIPKADVSTADLTKADVPGAGVSTTDVSTADISRADIPAAEKTAPPLAGVPRSWRYAAFRAHYFEVVPRMEDSNVLECEILRVIEDTFSIIILFRNKGCTEEGNYAILTYEMPKEAWEEIKGSRIFLKIPGDKLILMEK